MKERYNRKAWKKRYWLLYLFVSFFYRVCIPLSVVSASQRLRENKIFIHSFFLLLCRPFIFPWFLCVGRIATLRRKHKTIIWNRERDNELVYWFCFIGTVSSFHYVSSSLMLAIFYFLSSFGFLKLREVFFMFLCVSLGHWLLYLLSLTIRSCYYQDLTSAVWLLPSRLNRLTPRNQ